MVIKIKATDVAYAALVIASTSQSVMVYSVMLAITKFTLFFQLAISEKVIRSLLYVKFWMVPSSLFLFW